MATTSPASHAIVITGFAKLDDDGYGLSHHDKSHQPQLAGKNMNADVDNYLVAPFRVLKLGVRPGDRATVEYNGKVLDTVVGDTGADVGPSHSNGVGEMSLAAATHLGIPWSEAKHGPVVDGKKVWVTVSYYPGTHQAATHPKHRRIHAKHHVKKVAKRA